MQPRPINRDQLALSELLDRALNKGVVLWGDATISVAGVDLIYVGLKVLLASVDTAERLRQDARSTVQAANGAAEMIYVYAIADRPDEPLPGQLGLHDEGLAKVICRDVVAVVSTFDGSPLSQCEDELWRHEEVIEALMSDRAVLPMRFGTLLPSRQRVGDLLCRGYGALVQDIERVRGQVEIGMRFLTVSEGRSEDDHSVASSDRFDSARNRAGRRLFVGEGGQGPGASRSTARQAQSGSRIL